MTVSYINPFYNSFRHQAVVFDGTNDFMLRGAGLTGAADTKTGVFACWVKFNGGNGTLQYIADTNGGRFRVRRSAANIIEVIGSNAAGANILTMNSTDTVTTASGWTHILASWSLAGTAGWLYINDVDRIDTATDVFTNDSIDHTQTEHSIGATTAGASLLNASLADVWFGIGAALDLSVTANRRMFIDANARPVPRADRASIVVATHPIAAFEAPASAFATNVGDGGNYTVTGALTDANDRPGD
jgi:hypothetical protein